MACWTYRRGRMIGGRGRRRPRHDDRRALGHPRHCGRAGTGHWRALNNARGTGGSMSQLRESMLQAMGQFVSQKSSSWLCLRSILASSEHDMIVNRVRERIHGVRGDRCLRVVMHTYISEVVTESHLHVGACPGFSGWPGVVRTSWTTEGAMSGASVAPGFACRLTLCVPGPLRWTNLRCRHR